MSDENCEGCPVVNAASFYTAQSMADSVANSRLIHSANAAHHERNLVLAELQMQQAQSAAYEVGPMEARAISHGMTADEGQNKMAGLTAVVAAAQILAKTGMTTPPVTSTAGAGTT